MTNDKLSLKCLQAITKQVVPAWVMIVLLVCLPQVYPTVVAAYPTEQKVPIKGNKSDSVGVKIQRGEGIVEITEKLQNMGIIQHPLLFKIYAVITGMYGKIKAGYYFFKKPSGIIAALKTLLQGQKEIKVTIQEGLTARETAKILQDKLDIDTAKFIQLTNDTSYIKSIGVKASSLEGYLFPQTYFFYYEEEPDVIIRHLVKEFSKNITPEIQMGIGKSKLSMEEIITLASLVEGEAVVDSERPIIASVYYNRLKEGMLLQCDPSIQYLLPKHKTKVSYADLKIDSRYNTYLYKGLPPGPICSPSRSSILAAVFPAKTQYLYFVSEGRTHIFSKTNKEHILAKKRIKNAGLRMPD